MHRTTDGYRDGTFLTRCARCGRTCFDSELVTEPMQVRGGGESHRRVCWFHADSYHPQNDAQGYAPVDDVVPERVNSDNTRTSWTGTDDHGADDSLSIPTPTITSTDPASAAAAVFAVGGALNVYGTNFSSVYPTSKVRWDGIVVATTYQDATTLSAVIPAALCTVGDHAVTVLNMGPPYADTTSTSGLSQDADSLNTLNVSGAETMTLT